MLYDPRPYSGKITLLETIEQQVRTPFDPSRGWSRLSLREVETHLIPGNHLSMLNPPHVSDLAEKITLCLDKT
jgi:thioesterase domain-containing protein